MAYDGAQIKIPGAQAGGDLSSDLFKCVKKNATDQQYILCTADGEVFDGILYNKPSAAAGAAEIVMFGVAKVYTAEALTAGDLWGTGASGTAKIIEATNTGADTGDFVMGRVIKGAGSGEIATVTVGAPSYKVES